MNQILPVFLMGLLAVPLVFNSCQGGFKSQASLTANLASNSCKVTLQKGQALKITHSYNDTPQEFSASKLRLEDSAPKGSSAFQKSGGGDVVASGSALTAIYNNACLGQQRDVKGAKLWNLVSPDGSVEPSPELVRQAYTIKLQKDYETSTLNELVNNDPCVVGVSWEQNYTTQAVFNDVDNYQQGHMASIKAMEAYDSLYAGDLTQASTYTTPVRVAVVDSGVDWQHPDLQANFWVHSQGWGIDATTINSNLVNYNPFDVSSIGHGTHLAGLIGAVSNNSIGVVGTLPFNAKIMAIKIAKLDANNELQITSTYVYNGIQFAILNGANVINLSLQMTGSSFDAVTSSSVSDALASGITVVGAMGNGSPGELVDGTTVSYTPAILAPSQGMIAVGSYDSATGQKSSFSNYSTVYAEISAPGAENGVSDGIYSTLPTSKGSYGRLAGTSQSTAIVSGAAALAVSMIKRAYGMTPSPAEVERLLEESAVKNPNLSSYFKDGNQLDLAALVSKIHTEYPLTRTNLSVGENDGCL
jgi:hypothetical protein